jgi:hypothetical protein
MAQDLHSVGLEKRGLVYSFKVFSTMGKKIFLQIYTFQAILRLFYPYIFSKNSKMLKTDI